MPIIYNDLKQGTPEWFLIRCGIPTGSEFSRVMTGGSRQFSDKAKNYANEKVAEMITNQPQGSMYVSDDMELGQITEQEAADSYEFLNDVETEKVGFVTDDNGFYGVSPDRFVGKFGIVEIKRKNAAGMVKYLLEQSIDRAHIPQIQGNLLATGRLWCDWHLYNPDMPRLTIRTWRQERYIQNLRQDLEQFHKLKMLNLQRLAEAGYIDLNEMAARAIEARMGIEGEKIIAPCDTPEGKAILAKAMA